MIKDTYLTYPGANSLMKWQSEDEVLHGILLGILTTVLTYQVTAMAFDLFVGFKRRGEVQISDLSALLLVEESSVPRVTVNLFGIRSFARGKAHGFRSKCPENIRRNRKLSKKTSFKFLAFLLSAPLINIVAVFVTLGRDIILSFKDAGFGGIALGMSNNVTLGFNIFSLRYCFRHNTLYGKLDIAIAEFYTCFLTETDIEPAKFPSESTTELRVSRNWKKRAPAEALEIESRNSSTFFRLYIHSDIYSHRKPYRLKTSLQIEDGKRILNIGIQTMVKRCEHGAILGPLQSVSDTSSPQEMRWTIWRHVTCRAYRVSYYLDDTFEAMAAPIRIVNSGTFEVMDLTPAMSNEMGFFSGEDLPLLKRRSSFASFVVLLTAALCAILLRIIISSVTNNDVHMGIEQILKGKIGVSCCDSILPNNSNVYFRKIGPGEHILEDCEESWDGED